MSYPVPSTTAHAEIEIKKSRFIVYAFPINTRAEVMACLSNLKKQHPDARHYCWAYQIGAPQQASAGMDDDGEPSGTAGKPILSRIQYSGISDVAIIVVRYFGGIKLGAGGLARAYGQAAGAVLETLPTRTKQLLKYYLLEGPYDAEHRLRHWCRQAGVEIQQFHYTEAGIHAQLSVPETMLAPLQTQASQWRCILHQAEVS